MKNIILLLVLAAGCAPQMPPMTVQQKEAMELVWHQTYQEKAEEPLIRWRADLNCHWAITTYTPGGAYLGFTVPGLDGCYAGIYYNSGDFAQVANPGLEDNFPISETAFAHELLHAHLWRTYGDVDPNHLRSEWTTLLPIATMLLKNNGI